MRAPLPGAGMTVSVAFTPAKYPLRTVTASLRDTRTVPLRLSLLGPPRVDVDGAPLTVDTRKAVAVLARLALSGVQSRDVLAELLWPDAAPERSRAALRRTLSALRAGLGGHWLEADRGQVALSGEDVWVDIAEFRSLAAAGGRRDLERAVALHRGDLLEGFGLRDSAGFDDWQ